MNLTSGHSRAIGNHRYNTRSKRIRNQSVPNESAPRNTGISLDNRFNCLNNSLTTVEPLVDDSRDMPDVIGTLDTARQAIQKPATPKKTRKRVRHVIRKIEAAPSVSPTKKKPRVGKQRID